MSRPLAVPLLMLLGLAAFATPEADLDDFLAETERRARRGAPDQAAARRLRQMERDRK